MKNRKYFLSLWYHSRYLLEKNWSWVEKLQLSKPETFRIDFSIPDPLAVCNTQDMIVYGRDPPFYSQRIFLLIHSLMSKIRIRNWISDPETVPLVANFWLLAASVWALALLSTNVGDFRLLFCSFRYCSISPFQCCGSDLANQSESKP